MTYTKNHSSWSASDKITTVKMNNFETQYTEITSYLNSHDHTATYYTKAEMISTFWCADNDGAGSGADADLIYHKDGNMEVADFAGKGVPTGIIILWAESTIPTGWALCDGSNGTIDLRDKFVVGAGTGSNYSVGDAGNGIHKVVGSVTIAGHSLTTAEIAGHQHALQDKHPGSGACGYGQEGTGWRYPIMTSGSSTTGNSNIGKATADAHTHSATLEGDNFTITPIYYALKFIQKI
jgi:hypothetical protein